MRKLLLGAALASTCLAAPAYARDGAFYFEGDGGVMFLDNFDIDVNGVNDAARLRPDSRDLGIKVDGYDFGGIAGYDAGRFRLEVETSYKKANAGTLTVAGLGTAGAAGKTTAGSLMANALVDFGPDDGLQGFVGGGAGLARVSANIRTAGGTLVDDSDRGFAWQAIAGVRAPLSRNVDVGLKYRFFNVPKVNLVGAGGADLETKWRSHSILGTLTVNFGGRSEPVQEVAPPPPPPPPRHRSTSRPRRRRRLRSIARPSAAKPSGSNNRAAQQCCAAFLLRGSCLECLWWVCGRGRRAGAPAATSEPLSTVSRRL